MQRRKGPKSVNKPPPIQAIPKKTTFDGDNDIQFELELCWCVQQLQTALNSGKLNQKIAEDTAKNLKTLTSNTAPLIKKRQVMKLALGDYRLKMQQEEKKMLLVSKEIKFTPAAEMNKKSSFVKKSALLTSGKDFRFNFAVPDSSSTTTTTTPQVPQSAVETKVSSLFAGSNATAQPFKFNFSIDDNDAADDINLAGLAIKN
ncbi:LOW QUALITY PROTEIN: UPF0488 protein CG14286 [Drosophila nasuta]|uniref:LOW QUALITY PROTEIN: UPF0488 protein CG14286 n=1 Tax=Drosophila nasuta TaxID=42062 RepID=UPI00295F495F|nr:LOW QUALITY PROTEIN: UPF0488 protein CG14286 [Drosophila nasuta]